MGIILCMNNSFNKVEINNFAQASEKFREIITGSRPSNEKDFVNLNKAKELSVNLYDNDTRNNSSNNQESSKKPQE